MKKYELTEETEVVNGRTLHRIRALKDFGGVKAGELGGWIEKEENLSQDGDAWVCGDAKVYGDARVYGNALVYGDAEVYGGARVFNNARVYDNAEVCGNALVYDNAWVYDEARVYDNAWVYGHAEVCGDAWVYGNAEICAKFAYTKGRFIGGDDSGKITDITEQTGSYYWKHQYALGEYGIEDKEEPEKQTEQEDKIIELDGKKYKLVEVDG